MFLRIFCVSLCLFLASGEDVGFEAKVGKAIQHGIDKGMQVSSDLFISNLDLLKEILTESDYKAEKKMKKFDAKKIESEIILEEANKIVKDIVAKAKTAIGCSKSDKMDRVEEATESFKDLLEEVRDICLKQAAGPFLDALESSISLNGTDLDFDAEEVKNVDVIDQDGTITAMDFHDEILAIVNEGSKGEAGDVKIDFKINELLDKLGEELDQVKELIGA